MKSSFQCFRLSAAVLAFFTTLGSASAIPTTYRFWEDFPGGGTVTGIMVIDETQTSAQFPNYCFSDAVISFQAHRSGDSVSQPYDFGSVGHGIDFIWNVQTHQPLSFATVTIDPVFLLENSFNDHRYDELPDPYHGGYYLVSPSGIQWQAVPDGGSTLLYLGIALACFAPFLRRRKRAKA